MVASRPWNGLGVSIGEFEFNDDFFFGKSIDYVEVVLVGKGFLGCAVWDKSSGEASFIDYSRFEDSVASKAMHGHGAAGSCGVGPKTDIALVEGAGGEWK